MQSKNSVSPKDSKPGGGYIMTLPLAEKERLLDKIQIRATEFGDLDAILREVWYVTQDHDFIFSLSIVIWMQKQKSLNNE
jgi:hypothetical protein